jgi:hypothetical protein
MFELIPVPSEPIRQNWLRYYRMLERKLNKLKSDWRLFELQSQPLYQKWYYTTFANELARVRDWTDKAQQQDRILSAIVAHQRIYSLDELEAYIRVRTKLRQKRDPFPDPEDIERFQREQRERAERSRQRRSRDQERRQRERDRREKEAGFQQQDELWEYIQRKIREQEEAAARGDSGDDSHSGHERIVRAAESVDAEERREDEVKTLYRRIVRALHPDSGREMTQVEKEWWNQAQDAYKRRDLEILKLIALKVQSDGDVQIEKVDHIGTLVDLCAALIDERDQLTIQRRKMKRDPVFRFWSSRARPKNRDKLKYDLKFQLEQQARELRAFVQQTEATLEELDQMIQLRFGRR